MQNVINEIGFNKFAAVVSDNAPTIAAARKKLTENYPHIMNIRCVAHLVNLITKDILGKFY
jgi:hypothetical protein